MDGCDVICLDSDEEGENVRPASSKRHPTKKMMANARGARGGTTAVFRNRIPALLEPPTSMAVTPDLAIEEQLLRPLQELSLKLYFECDSFPGCIRTGSGAGLKRQNTTTGIEGNGSAAAAAALDLDRCTAVVKKVAELVQRFGKRKFSNGVHDVAQQRDAWNQVLKFLFLLRAIGSGSIIYETHPPGKDLPVAAAAVDKIRSGPSWQHCHPPAELRRYRMAVMDVLVGYIRYKCSTLAGERNPSVLLDECNQIVSTLHIIFNGDREFVTLTLLKMDLQAGSSAVALMYPVFEQILTTNQQQQQRMKQEIAATTDDEDTVGGQQLDLQGYVRLLLCYKKWKAMVPARRDKDTINALAVKVLPTRCPPVRTRQDLPFAQMLPRISASSRSQDEETRFLLGKDLMEIEQLCAIYFREYEKRFFRCGSPKLSTLEIKSNYINIDALAEFIQRKCNLLKGIIHRTDFLTANMKSEPTTPGAGHQQQQQTQSFVHRGFGALPVSTSQPQHPPHPSGQNQKNKNNNNPNRTELQLLHEANAIISSLRLIFRRDEEFIALTLLSVRTCPEFQPILGPVFERFFGQGHPANAGSGVNTNTVESYGRMLLCYVKWKQLYRADSAGRRRWEQIDRLALATLPYDFPRAFKRRELALRALFPKVLSNEAVANFGTGPAARKQTGTTGGRYQKHSVTISLLNSRHVWANIQEMCLQFLAICRDGRISRHGKAPPMTYHPPQSSTPEDDEVQIIKTDSNSPVIVLDSDADDDKSHVNRDDDDYDNDDGSSYDDPEKENQSVTSVCTDTEMRNDPKLKTTTHCHLFNRTTPHTLDGNYCPADHHSTTLMGTVFNTPPPTPQRDDCLNELQPSTTTAMVANIPLAAPTLPTLSSKFKRKPRHKPLPSFKLSHTSIRISSSQGKRDFLSAFRRLVSKENFQINLRSERNDYCLMKRSINSTLVVQIISANDFHPLSGFLTPPLVTGNEQIFANRSFTATPSIISLEEPILQTIPRGGTEATNESQRSRDEQLRSLMSVELDDDFPMASPAVVDFAIFPEVDLPSAALTDQQQHQAASCSSMEQLTNDQMPPSAMVAESSLWSSDDDVFSIFANLDYNPWTEEEHQHHGVAPF
ncbi:uncharacterized protein LOC129751900 [Uranotaenia lowii]|uniref:uncharacterized protein LOC129751900 n=1 Tax=Uranotaenia lowii TaxID=190385 RepID=UPI00247886D9|nr:uncharacterized protein LOC129751900 [Uranotaenia lowii]